MLFVLLYIQTTQGLIGPYKQGVPLKRYRKYKNNKWIFRALLLFSILFVISAFVIALSSNKDRSQQLTWDEYYRSRASIWDSNANWHGVLLYAHLEDAPQGDFSEKWLEPVANGAYFVHSNKAYIVTVAHTFNPAGFSRYYVAKFIDTQSDQAPLLLGRPVLSQNEMITNDVAIFPVTKTGSSTMIEPFYKLPVHKVKFSPLLKADKNTVIGGTTNITTFTSIIDGATYNVKGTRMRSYPFTSSHVAIDISVEHGYSGTVYTDRLDRVYLAIAGDLLTGPFDVHRILDR